MTEAPPVAKPGKRRLWLTAVGLTMIIVAAGGGVYLSSARAPAGKPSDANAQFSVGAEAVVSAAVQQEPAGYTLESSKGDPQAGADWAVLGQSDGSVANITAVVFSSSSDSQAYFGRLVSNLKGLPGYTDATSALSSFEGFGSCYGYGEDVDGLAVANGVCTKGNVLLQVHLVSNKSFAELEADMTSLMGALYQSVQ